MPDETKPEVEVTKTGRTLTDADIEALADEAERGYDVEHLTGRRGTAKENALRDFELACNFVALAFGESPERKIAIKARGDMREAIGEARR